MKNETGIKERWENYRKANNDRPLVRNNELKEIFNLLNPQAGEIILEVGTGNGYLTFPIADSVRTGKIVTADVGEDNLRSVIERNTGDLPIKTMLFNDEEMFSDLKDGSFDAVATIATLHHFDNRNRRSGERGRIKALKEFNRVLRTSGRLVIADVIHDSISQKYFDAIDNPEHCFPEGHPHDFFKKERLNKLLEEAGFKKINIEVKKVPWQFSSESEAVDFVHTIHNAKCSPEDSFKIAKDYLGFTKINGNYELGWELYFATAIK